MLSSAFSKCVETVIIPYFMSGFLCQVFLTELLLTHCIIQSYNINISLTFAVSVPFFCSRVIKGAQVFT